MFKLTKEQKEQKAALHDKLTTLCDQFTGAIDIFNTTRNEAFSILQAAVTTYNESVRVAFETVSAIEGSFNEALQEARDFAEGVTSDAQAEFDDKSERWQESDKGMAAESWIDAWEEFDGTEIAVDEPDDIEIEEPDDMEFETDVVDAFDELPDEAE